MDNIPNRTGSELFIVDNSDKAAKAMLERLCWKIASGLSSKGAASVSSSWHSERWGQVKYVN